MRDGENRIASNTLTREQIENIRNIQEGKPRDVKLFCIVKDDSGHVYVIPFERREDWMNLDFEIQEVPNWATYVNGMAAVVFPSYEVR